MRISDNKKAPPTGKGEGLVTGIDLVQFVKASITQNPTKLNNKTINEKRGQHRASSLLMPALFGGAYRGVKSDSNTGIKIHTSASKQACILFAGVNSKQAGFLGCNSSGPTDYVPMYNNGTFTQHSTPQRGKRC